MHTVFFADTFGKFLDFEIQTQPIKKKKVWEKFLVTQNDYITYT